MYLKQAFKGKNKFVLYLLTTIILLFSSFIGALPMKMVLYIKEIEFIDISNLASKIDLNLLLILNIIPFLICCISLYLCVKYLHKKKFKYILTARNSFDFKRALKGAAIWGIIILITMIPDIFNNNSSLVFNYQPDKFYLLILICLLILPFQTSLEELLFRGYYMQGTAVTVKNRWMPLIITSIIFGLLHSANPEVAAFGFWVAMPNYIIMGFILGITAIMDDGLELPLGMHFANNFVGAILITNKNSALQTPALFIDSNPSMSYMDTIIITICGLGFILICSKLFKWGSFKKIFSPIIFNN